MRANPVFGCYEPKNMVESQVWYGMVLVWGGVAWRGVIWYDMVWCGLGCEGISNCVLGVLTTLTSI